MRRSTPAPASLAKLLVGAGFQLTLLAAVGCGDDDGVGSCTLTEEIGTLGTIRLCQEGSGSARGQLQQACQQSIAPPADAGFSVSAIYADAPCSHVGALGGCRITQAGATMAVWYYEDPSGLTKPSNIRDLCARIGSTYLAP